MKPDVKERTGREEILHEIRQSLIYEIKLSLQAYKIICSEYSGDSQFDELLYCTNMKITGQLELIGGMSVFSRDSYKMLERIIIRYQMHCLNVYVRDKVKVF